MHAGGGDKDQGSHAHTAKNMLLRHQGNRRNAGEDQVSPGTVQMLWAVLSNTYVSISEPHMYGVRTSLPPV